MHIKTTALWRASVICFLLAGATGALFRFGFVFGFPFGLDAANVRHAHSHLMYFGWTTPAIMTWMISSLRPYVRRGYRFAWWTTALSLIMALLAYGAFLAAGYRPVLIFGRSLPIASIVSSLTMIVWYGFAGWYGLATRSLPRSLSIRLWDVALFLMVLSTAGTWGRFLIEIRHINAPIWADTAVYFYMHLFSHGWLLLGSLGAAIFSVTPLNKTEHPWIFWLLAVSLPFAALLGSDLSYVSPRLAAMTQAGTVLASAVLGWLAWHVIRLLKKGGHRHSRALIIFFIVTIALLFAQALPSVLAWGNRTGFRIMYIHVLTLGTISTGLITAARQMTDFPEIVKKWNPPPPNLFAAAAAVLLVGIIPLTPLWPWGGPTSRLFIAAVTSVLPLAATVYGFITQAKGD